MRLLRTQFLRHLSLCDPGRPADDVDLDLAENETYTRRFQTSDRVASSSYS